MRDAHLSESYRKEIFLALSVLRPKAEFFRVFEADVEEWEEAARFSVVCRTFPVFLKNLKELGLENRLSDKSLAALHVLSGQAATRTDALLKLSDRLLGRLGSLGISAIPLKGISVAKYYPDPLLRSMSDIDLLIARRDFPGCRAALEDFGFCPVDSVRNGVLVNPGQECLFQDEKGLQVDVHYLFFPWFEEDFVYKIAAEDFIERAVSEETARSLLPEDELYYFLLVLHRSRMRSFWHWMDVDALMHHFSGRLRGERLALLIHRSPLREWLMNIMAQSESLLGVPWSGLLGTLPTIDCGRKLKNSMLFPARRRSRIEERIFLWNCVQNPFDKLRLLSVFLKWQFFKTAGFFKKEFVNAHNPTKEEIYLKKRTDTPTADRWRLNEARFVSRELDGEHIIVDLRSGEYFTIDGAGGLMFDNLVRGKTPAEIETSILDRCSDASGAQVRKDLAGLIKRLRRQKIIRND